MLDVLYYTCQISNVNQKLRVSKWINFLSFQTFFFFWIEGLLELEGLLLYYILNMQLIKILDLDENTCFINGRVNF